MSTDYVELKPSLIVVMADAYRPGRVNYIRITLTSHRLVLSFRGIFRRQGDETGFCFAEVGFSKTHTLVYIYSDVCVFTIFQSLVDCLFC